MELDSRPPSLVYAGLFYARGVFVPRVRLYRGELRWWLVEFFRGDFREAVKQDPLIL